MRDEKIKKIVKEEVRNILKESSLSRVWWHNHEHDCGAITAYRAAKDCAKGEKYSRNDNQKRNKSLLAKLQSKGYGVTKLVGKSNEGGKIATEMSFFVVDLEDFGTLEKDLKKIGEIFEQDSILFIPRKAIENEAQAYLVGTTHCSNAWVGYGKKLVWEKGKIGVASKIYTSYVNGRPFMFEAVEGKMYSQPGSGYGWWALHTIAKRD
jgi:hypothetical protein